MMLRLLDVTRWNRESEQLRQLHASLGLPLEDTALDHLASWLERNPAFVHLYEADGRLSGYASLIPIARESHDQRVAGEGRTPMELTLEEILPPAAHTTAQWEGVWIWIERFVAATVTARQKLGEHVYHSLAHVHLKGLMVTARDANGEADCRWLGLVEQEALSNQAHPGEKLWSADEHVVAPTPEQPFGPPTPVRCLFLMVRKRFGPVPLGLQLSPAERRIARLFYLEDRKASDIARLLDIQADTVKSYLQRIRAKAEPLIGSRLSRRIAAYLQEHPGEAIDLTDIHSPSSPASPIRFLPRPPYP